MISLVGRIYDPPFHTPFLRVITSLQGWAERQRFRPPPYRRLEGLGGCSSATHHSIHRPLRVIASPREAIQPRLKPLFLALALLTSGTTQAAPLWTPPTLSWATPHPITAADIQAFTASRQTSTPLDPGGWINLTCPQNTAPSLKIAAPTCKTAIIGTRHRWHHGYFSARLQITPNAHGNFYLLTDDHYQIDIAGALTSHQASPTLHHWTDLHDHAITTTIPTTPGWHEFAALWTDQEIIYALDGTPTAAITLLRPIKGSAQIRLSLTQTGELQAGGLKH